MTGTKDARARLLRAAEAMFYEQGIGNTGIDALTARAGVGKMSLYRHFAGKDELVAETLRQRDERHRAWLLPDEPGDPRDRLLGVFDRIADAIEGSGGTFRGCPFVKAVSELEDAGHPAWPVAREHKARLTSALVRLAAEAGAADAGRLAGDLLVLIDGAAVQGVIRQDAAPVRAARRMAALVIDDAMEAGRRVGTRVNDDAMEVE
ncbi:TetR/AcrR family transcriptional regulator [Actinoallomurus vinaceus]|uniref:TetR/AcrR family transcriptional regulator n=1 Tax=Actinoallomurus vinaceus TaxID=1080074 RepID=A0ABP8UKP5_9ACTN